MHLIHLGLWSHLAPLPSRMKDIWDFWTFFPGRILFFKKAERLCRLFFYLLNQQNLPCAALEMLKCTAEPTQTSLHHGFNTYPCRSHMMAKNRSKSHSHHQPLLPSHLPSSYYPLFLNTPLAPNTSKSAPPSRDVTFRACSVF